MKDQTLIETFFKKMISSYVGFENSPDCRYQIHHWTKQFGEIELNVSVPFNGNRWTFETSRWTIVFENSRPHTFNFVSLDEKGPMFFETDLVMIKLALS